jgi:hypothetical protein
MVGKNVETQVLNFGSSASLIGKPS